MFAFTLIRLPTVWLFGQLKDHWVVPKLLPLLHEEEINCIDPWALGEIGDNRAVEPLIDALEHDNPSMRVLSIYVLKKLKAPVRLRGASSLC